MQDLTEKRMDELMLNEWVLTPTKNASGVEENVVRSWLHRMPDVVAEFLVYFRSTRFSFFRLQTDDGKELKLTRRHLIVRADCNNPRNVETVPAEDITEGECLLTYRDGDLVVTSVTHIDSVWQKGIYAPNTDTGKVSNYFVLIICLRFW